MQSSDVLNCAVRVKEEPSDELPSENNYEMIDEKPDLKNFQFLSFSQENSIPTPQKYDINHESKLDNEVEIVVECEDVKPNMDLLIINKIESVEEVKQEFVGDNAEESDSNLECGIDELNKKKRVEKKPNNEHNLKTDIDTRHIDAKHSCEICGKNFSHNGTLNRHFKSVHRRITHSCDICNKTFSQKSSLKVHIDSIHKGIISISTCGICGKTIQKSNLKVHIDSIHKGIIKTCDICGKSFARKSSLKIHIDSVHKGIRYVCDVCGKKFAQKGYLKMHIGSTHADITCKSGNTFS